MLRERLVIFGICEVGAGGRRGHVLPPSIALTLSGWAVQCGRGELELLPTGDHVGCENCRHIARAVFAVSYGQVCKEINGLQVS